MDDAVMVALELRPRVDRTKGMTAGSDLVHSDTE
jgi:hypothetical protein